ncbi:4Fe-4S dicluster domain-containing protein [Sporohalobacter salinus]|uniref:4Fe-4S dicluster domain-containing protein n=1 Tax=Sporohalobacter salinus TaxID=1494606 RepID=UPI001960C561|nr:4Fe-4S dicluster domain-containing protein [Sporohalobacter salinus]MBM7624691.1 adenylylsulfate reductase subunit B [Sporohalobacter salinus]
MTIRIDKDLCNGCGNKEEPYCMQVCPGNLLYKNEKNKAVVREKADCWDCAACVKECPRQAIEMYLPAEIGGRGATLKAEVLDGEIVWTLKKVDGSVEEFKVQNKLQFNLNL